MSSATSQNPLWVMRASRIARRDAMASGIAMAMAAAHELGMTSYTRVHKSASRFAAFWFANTHKNATEQGADFCTSV